MPLYRNSKTGQIVEWHTAHYEKVGDRKYWEPVEQSPPKKQAKKKAKKKAK